MIKLLLLTLLAGGTEVTFESDGNTVYADLYDAGKKAPVILLFHQAGSNAAEYDTIAPRLSKAGFTCLAPDLRGGGRMFDSANRTLDRNGLREDYVSAYKDMQAALAFLKKKGYRGPYLAWGSSYTAAQVFRLADDHREIAAVLSFSPGRAAVAGPWPKKVKVPVYITAAPGGEEAMAKQVFDAVSHKSKTLFIPRQGVHGSSTLRKDRNASGAEEGWTAVTKFLSSLTKKGGRRRRPRTAPQKQDPKVLWKVETKSDSKGSGAIADIDGDGKLEIVFGTYFNDEHIYAINAEDGSVAWKHKSDGGPFDASVTIVDLDRDGKPEIMAGDSSSGNIHCLDGTGKLLWKFKLPNSTDSVPAVADLEGDGVLDIVVGSMWRRDGAKVVGDVSVIRADTRKVVWTAQIPGCVQSEPCLTDLNGDKVLDVIVTSWRGDRGVHALNGKDGSELWTVITDGSDKSMGMYHGVSLLPDGRIVVGTYDRPTKGKLYVISRDGKVLWTKDMGGMVFAPTQTADVDGDGNHEIIVPAKTLRVLRARDGEEIWSRDLPMHIDRGVAVADVDGDKDPDIVFLCGRKAYALDGKSGREVWSFDVSDGDPQFEISSGPLLSDFDDDGTLDLFFVIGRGFSGKAGTPYARDKNHGLAIAVRIGPGKGPAWTTFRGNLMRTGMAPKKKDY